MAFDFPYGQDYSDPLAEDGAALLDDVHAFLGRFVAYPSEAGGVATYDSTPRLALGRVEMTGQRRTCCVSAFSRPWRWLASATACRTQFSTAVSSRRVRFCACAERAGRGSTRRSRRPVCRRVCTRTSCVTPR